MTQVVVCALYRFVTLEDYISLQAPLLHLMREQSIRGTLLLAREGINGTVAGSRLGIDALLNHLRADARLSALTSKESFVETMPFRRTKVRLKKEIVTMGVDPDTIDPQDGAGTYVKPKDWNALISDPEVTLVDTRNDYEFDLGTFKKAINPQTKTFRAFPQYVQTHLNPDQHKKVAMFCTGGIRCEKATAYLKSQGFDQVFHLEGGILKYLEDVPQDQSLWEGECFVFDERVSVDHSLDKGGYDLCYACRLPITEQDKQSEHYVQGISCPRCIGQHNEAQIARFAQRQKQVDLAQARGQTHLGPDALD